jgi:hypothetical protein
MRKSAGLLLAFLLHLPAADQDPRVADALYRVSREASGLWQTAPRFLARETISQKALVSRKAKVKFSVGAAAVGRPAPKFENREIVSFYSMGAYKDTPEALREFRHMISVDGKALQDESAAREKFVYELASNRDMDKEQLRSDFEKTCVAGAATDFGQLILLFTKPNLPKYAFTFAGETRIGVDEALAIGFEQQGGAESLHISEGNKKMQEKLRGEIAVRRGDFLPLRIDLNSSHSRDKNEIRDEAKLDYTVVSGALLPAALVYRRWVNDEMVLESIYRYSQWQPIKAR